jgi:DNA-binding IclR family transcriptional regulator
MEGQENKNKNVQAVDRALSILEALAKEGAPMSLTLISSELKLNISTVHRLLATLIAAKFVVQEKDSGKYKLGLKVFEIGYSVVKNLNIPQIAKPYLKELVEKFNETINLAVLDGKEVIYIDQVESKNVVKMLARPGTRAPAYCTGSGKILLSKFKPHEIDREFANYKFVKYTENSAGNVEELQEKINRVRQQGYSIDREEMENAVRCAAVPIFNHEENLIAALSLSGPRNRLSYEFLTNEVVPELNQAAQNISRLLGNIR